MQTLVINGQEKETKYSKGWLDSYGREWIYEDMETSHLLNVYHHIKNNIQCYIQLGYLRENLPETEAYKNVINTRTEIKSELLSRGLTDSEIENHIEETWKIGPNPYTIEV